MRVSILDLYRKRLFLSVLIAAALLLPACGFGGSSGGDASLSSSVIENRKAALAAGAKELTAPLDEKYSDDAAVTITFAKTAELRFYVDSDRVIRHVQPIGEAGKKLVKAAEKGGKLKNAALSEGTVSITEQAVISGYLSDNNADILIEVGGNVPEGGETSFFEEVSATMTETLAPHGLEAEPVLAEKEEEEPK